METKYLLFKKIRFLESLILNGIKGKTLPRCLNQCLIIVKRDMTMQIIIKDKI